MSEMSCSEHIDLLVVAMLPPFYVTYIWDIPYPRHVEAHRDSGKSIRFRLDPHRVVVFIEAITAFFYT